MSTSPRIVAVFGATGTQGSSVVKALLADGTFVPRAITRNSSSERALKLKTLGAQVAQADLWDIDSLKQALSGVEAVYGVCHVSFQRPDLPLLVLTGHRLL